ncbi:hypothetical protein [Tianweitania sp.]|uniref:hypothetical protein n=1 Tax=Tianweitania sp. TaxID=2021634 RepID=UPI0028986115|nr:hypothetical protein [Tianweitania sp.]
MAPPSRSIQDVVDQYLLSRRSKLSAISTADATRAIKSVLPASSASDREIEDLIVASAAHRGMALHFDLPRTAA